MSKQLNKNKHTLDIVVTDYFSNIEWIKELVASIQKLDCAYRVIRVSDTDDGPSATLFNSLPGTQYIYAPAGDRGASKQLGLDNASADYIMFLDNDDYLLTQHLEKYLKYFYLDRYCMDLGEIYHCAREIAAELDEGKYQEIEKIAYKNIYRIIGICL